MAFTSWLRSLQSRLESRQPRRRRRAAWTGLPPILETLEDRTLPSGYVVTTTADSGAGSLRDAITQINNDTTDQYLGSHGVNEIDFAITGGTGYNSSTGIATITPHSALPPISNPVFIDGYTQGHGTALAASCNTMSIGDNAILKIVLDGSQAGSVNGLTIGGGNSTLRGLVIDNFAVATGIVLNGSGTDVVAGNFIGTDVTGGSAAANSSGIYAGSPGNMIGGSSPGDRNIISGNNSGTVPNAVALASNGNLIQGNYIGTDTSGTSALANGPDGVSVTGSSNTIGGTAAGAGNVISGNAYWGININGNLNLVAGNLIGTDATGLAALGNGEGIDVSGNNNTIGGTTAGARNVISGNIDPEGSFGIVIGTEGPSISQNNLVEGNYIGTDITGTAALGYQLGISVALYAAYNTIGGTTAAARNIISGNGGTGIQIVGSSSFCNTVQGNYIGTDPSGTHVVPNGFLGIYVWRGAHDNTIGGTVPGAGNVISGNPEGGILLGWSGLGDVTPTGAKDNIVEGNLIGTDKTGTVALGTGSNDDGIDIESNDNTIGGTMPGAGNVISGNSGFGVNVEGGSGNAILGNSIFANGGLGIVLNSATNANDNQAAPVLTGLTGAPANPMVSGTLQGAASTTFRIEFFVSDNNNGANGQTLVGSTYVITGSNGQASIPAMALSAFPTAQVYVTATATVATLSGGSYTYGDTSPFSSLVLMPNPSIGPSFAVTNTGDDDTSGSLLWAINQVNTDTHALSTINFDISASGVQTISLATALPVITHPVVINGLSQPGSSANTLSLTGSNTLTVGDNAVRNIVLAGTAASANGDGLAIAAGGSTVEGLTIENFGNAIHLETAGNDAITGNYLSAGGTGVLVDGVSSNTIGGPGLAAHNTVVNAFVGIAIQGVGATGNEVEGDYIGTDGIQFLGGFRGVLIGGGSNNVVGGPAAGAGNVIAGYIQGVLDNASGTTVQGNYINIGATGAALVVPGTPTTTFDGNDGVWAGDNDTIAGNVIAQCQGKAILLQATGCTVEGNMIGTNGLSNGIAIEDDFGANTIGTTTAGTGNTIENSQGPAVYLAGSGATLAGNTITSNDGPAVEVGGTGDSIRANSIYDNFDTNGNTGPAIDNLDQDAVVNQFANYGIPYPNLGPTFFDTNWPGGPFTGTNNTSFNGLTLTQNGSTLTYSGTLTGGVLNTRYLVTFAAISNDGTNWGSYYTYLNTDTNGQVNNFSISFQAPQNFPSNSGTLQYPSATANPPHSLGNFEQNYPVLSAAQSGSDVLVSGTLNGQANTAFTVDVFANPTADPSGYGQGQYYLGATTVTTDATGKATFAADFSAANLPNGVVPAGWYISATATDPNGNTSEFSQDVTATASTQQFTQAITTTLQTAISTNEQDVPPIEATPATASAVASAIAAVTVPQNTTANVYLNLVPGTYAQQTVQVPTGMTLYINGQQGTTIDPASPAFTVTAGNVVVSNVTFVTTGNAPTILVTGGSLTLRNDTIQGSTSGNDAAIAVTGGTLDLGTAASPGDNTINVNGPGLFVNNATTNAVPTNNDTFEVNGSPVAGPALNFTSLTSSQLAFTAAPSSTFAGFNLNSPSGVQVSVDDQLGDVETGNSSTVSLAITSSPASGAFLSGSTTSAKAQNGVAVFTNLAFNLSGTYTLKATDGSLTAATATVVIQPNTGVLLLDPTGQSLNVSGNATLNVTNYGAIVIDSSNAAAGAASSNATVTATEIDVHGGVSTSGNAAFHGVINKGAAVLADPLATLAAPSKPSTQFTAGSYSGTLQPGTYVGGITVSGNNSVTLSAGTYYLTGGGLTVSGNAKVTGTGVMIYITGLTGTSPTAVSISGNADVTLTPETSGTYQGVVLFEDRSLNGAITVSGNGALNTTGTEYAAGATVTLSGNDDTDNPSHTSLGSQWIVDDLVLGGNAKFAITADANNRSDDPNAFMVVGPPPNPPPAAGEGRVGAPVAALTLSDADAAVAEALSLWAAAGLDAGTLQALSRTTITIAPLPALYLGLAAPGVIYLDPTAEGYGWFTGTPTLPSPVAGGGLGGGNPPANKIDLLTVVSHELGHEFGLMDGNGTALMASTLAAGVRILPDAGDLQAPHATLSVPSARRANTESAVAQPAPQSPVGNDPIALAFSDAAVMGVGTPQVPPDVAVQVIGIGLRPPQGNGDAALAAILAEPTSADNFAKGVADVNNATFAANFANGQNGNYFLVPDATRFDNPSKDTRDGGPASDWLFADAADKTIGLTADRQRIVTL